MKRNSLKQLVIAAFSLCMVVHAEERRSIQPSDCVTVRYLKDDSPHASIQVTPQGTRFAFLVKTPNLQTNNNDISLYVRPMSKEPDETGPLITGEGISSLQWLADGRHVTFLMHVGGAGAVVELDTVTGKHEIVGRTSDDVVEYTTDGSGDEVVFATQLPETKKQFEWTAQQMASGYRIPFGETATQVFPKRQLFVTSRRGNGSWTTPRELTIHSPFTQKAQQVLTTYKSLFLSLSPDGRQLLLRYLDGEMPEEWKKSPFGSKTFSIGFPGVVALVHLDLQSGATTMPLRTPFASSLPLWSSDSESFLVTSYSPVDSSWEKDDIAENGQIPADEHLFWVSIARGTVEEVASRVADSYERPLFWTNEGGIVIHTSANTIDQVVRTETHWTVSRSLKIPNLYRSTTLASNGHAIVGDYQNTLTPPSLFFFDPEQKTMQTIVKLNAQFDQLILASVREVQWRTSTGYGVQGLLLTPPDANPGVLPPLVIQTKPDYGQFLCDTGESHYPSFAPQPMATAGMAYLVRTISDDYSPKDEMDHYPKDYPGQVAEAAFQMDIWDSAVKTLGDQGLFDPKKVGIIGFSRSGWYTEFILAHSKTKYLAATTADNVQYSLGELWYRGTPETIRGYEAMYGGPPFGSTLKNWLDYSVSFNLDKFHTPLLMEQIGYGLQYDSVRQPPDSLALGFEVFAGLNELNKPVELYYYPNEEHQIDHPRARLATLQRNLDWYRFWLQDYERPHPEDPDQYARWRRLSILHERDTLNKRGTVHSGKPMSPPN
jgi:dipeptidyl aminopeptidase/acylaminoacyl peptidase